ncbi:MAG: tyrosine-type recombinase/integrase [Lachnospiraceae bacterium]|nr:tyrosine-type recombinase/integrase [Lachnospiraceae bacterium]
MATNYHEEQKTQNILKMRAVLEELPPFCKEFFRGIEQYTSARTRLAYAYDLRMFFEFLHEKNSACARLEISQIPLSYLDMLNRQDIEEYLEYVSLYQKDGISIINEERGKSRKLASLRSFYNYFFETEKIEKNPAALVPLPKQHEKEIIRLGTGIRVSECVGLDLQDVDFDVYGIRILRKGGKEAIIYFGEEVGTALLDYLEQREHMVPVEGHENALFLSLQNRRMAVRSVENLVKKYASRVTTLKKITPHKLRSTYGTALYQETGDIYLVADVLGHSDVNTTRKHYAAQADERRRRAANAVRLREK